MALAVSTPRSALHPERTSMRLEIQLRTPKSSGSRAQEERVSRKRHCARLWNVDIRDLEDTFVHERKCADKREERERKCCDDRKKRRGQGLIRNETDEAVSRMHNSSPPRVPNPKEVMSKGQVFVIDRNGTIGFYWDTPRRPHPLPPASAFVNFSSAHARGNAPDAPVLHKFGARVRQLALRKDWTGQSTSTRSREHARDEDPDSDHRAGKGAVEVTTLPILLFPPHIPGVMARRALLLTQLDRRCFNDYVKHLPGGPGQSRLRCEV